MFKLDDNCLDSLLFYITLLRLHLIKTKIEKYEENSTWHEILRFFISRET